MSEKVIRNVQPLQFAEEVARKGYNIVHLKVSPKCRVSVPLFHPSRIYRNFSSTEWRSHFGLFLQYTFFFHAFNANCLSGTRCGRFHLLQLFIFFSERDSQFRSDWILREPSSGVVRSNSEEQDAEEEATAPSIVNDIVVAIVVRRHPGGFEHAHETRTEQGRTVSFRRDSAATPNPRLAARSWACII